MSISSGNHFQCWFALSLGFFSGRGGRLVALVLVQVLEAFMLGEDILALILLCYYYLNLA